jgi:hypothetical protein
MICIVASVVKLQTAVYWIKPPGKGKPHYSIKLKAWLRKKEERQTDLRGRTKWAGMKERSSCLGTEADGHDGQNSVVDENDRAPFGWA